MSLNCSMNWSISGGSSKFRLIVWVYVTVPDCAAACCVGSTVKVIATKNRSDESLGEGRIIDKWQVDFEYVRQVIVVQEKAFTKNRHSELLRTGSFIGCKSLQKKKPPDLKSKKFKGSTPSTTVLISCILPLRAMSWIVQSKRITDSLGVSFNMCAIPVTRFIRRRLY